VAYTLDQCRLCWLYHHDIDYREHWDDAAAPAEPLACRHRGPASGATVRCPSCHGTVNLKLFGCALFGACTLARPASVACCATCAERAPLEEDE
jgi:hypothetical protein